jgi:hypothetical protein
MTIPIELKTWALRHHVGQDALAELAGMLGAGDQKPSPDGGSESRVQGQVRLAAPMHDMRLWRNNVGALLDKRGVPVRFGLANDSKALNDRIKSGDLIGWKRRVIVEADVGTTIAQFVSLECKPSGWKYCGDDHEVAQMRWAGMVAVEGGIAKFVTGPESIA